MKTMIETNVVFGQTYTDRNSGFTGKAVCISKWQYGCLRVTLQPETGDDGKLPETQTFDEPALMEALDAIDDQVGGPRPEPQQNPSPMRR